MNETPEENQQKIKEACEKLKDKRTASSSDNKTDSERGVPIGSYGHKQYLKAKQEQEEKEARIQSKLDKLKRQEHHEKNSSAEEDNVKEEEEEADEDEVHTANDAKGDLVNAGAKEEAGVWKGMMSSDGSDLHCEDSSESQDDDTYHTSNTASSAHEFDQKMQQEGETTLTLKRGKFNQLDDEQRNDLKEDFNTKFKDFAKKLGKALVDEHHPEHYFGRRRSAPSRPSSSRTCRTSASKRPGASRPSSGRTCSTLTKFRSRRRTTRTQRDNRRQRQRRRRPRRLY